MPIEVRSTEFNCMYQLFHTSSTSIREDLKSLEYLKYCIKESMRLFPPVAAIGRSLDKDTMVDGRLMPKGSPVYCHIHAVHRNPDVWENPKVEYC